MDSPYFFVFLFSFWYCIYLLYITVAIVTAYYDKRLSSAHARGGTRATAGARPCEGGGTCKGGGAHKGGSMWEGHSV